MFETSGRLILDPVSKSIPFRPWWGIVSCCADLGEYYRTRIAWENRARFKVQTPSWGPHISVIRGELVDEVLWQEMKEKAPELKFTYGHEVQANEKHFWLKVEFSQGEEIRRRLGLAPSPEYPFHLTIAVRSGGVN